MKPIRIRLMVLLLATHLLFSGYAQSSGNSADTSASCDILIPVTFLPAFKAVIDEDGTQKRVMTDAFTTLRVPAQEVILVLVDLWNVEDPPTGMAPSVLLQNNINLLAMARQHGIKVIHAPNKPVVDRYPQYARLQEELANYNASTGNKKAYMRRAPFGNPSVTEPYALRQQMRLTKGTWRSTTASLINPPEPGKSYSDPPCIAAESTSSVLVSEGSITKGLDISRFLQPLDSEYVLQSYEEYRYVLAKHRISTILYAGGALNECMMQRPTGINVLAGTDGMRMPFNLVVLGDCSAALESPRLSAEEFKVAMLDYLKLKMAFVSDYKLLRFTAHDPEAPRIE